MKDVINQIYVTDNTDCDDTKSISVGHDEVCDVLDNDCDGLSVMKTTVKGQPPFFRFNRKMVVPTSRKMCPPGGFVDNDTDCDDENGSIYPNGNEVCDGIDNDCGGLVDDDDNSVDVSVGGSVYISTSMEMVFELGISGSLFCYR